MKIFYLATIVLVDSICSFTVVNYRRENTAEMSLDEFNRRILDAHNRLRKQVAIRDKATDMFKMATDQELVALAKRHTDRCEWRHDYPHSENYDRVGQNGLKGGGFPVPENVPNLWFSEGNRYTYESMTCKEGKECKHYTQVVRAETKYIGCAFQKCGRSYFVYCNYGNDYKVPDHPYKIGNRPCEDCPNNCIESALCDTNYTITIPPEECKDTKICIRYGTYVCTGKHKEWGLKNCIQFCGFCVGIATTTTTTTTAVPTTLAPEDCKDKIEGCANYGKSVCTGKFKQWASVRCMKFCGFCIGITTAPTTLAPKDCKDKIEGCANYGKSVCTGKFKQWANVRCMKFCGFCSDIP